MKKILVLVAFLACSAIQTKAQFRVGVHFNFPGGSFYLGDDGMFYSNNYPPVQNGWWYDTYSGQSFPIPQGYYCTDPFSAPILIQPGYMRNGCYSIQRCNNRRWNSNNSGCNNYGPPRHYHNGNRRDNYNGNWGNNQHGRYREYDNGYGRRHHNHYYGGR